MSEQIGILGGTFNPVHIAHLFIGYAAAEAFNLQKVLMLPCTVSPFKVGAENMVSGADRLEMVQRAVAGDPVLRVCCLDLERGGVSYAIESVKALRAKFPAARFSFIIGGDSLRELHGWYKIDEMLGLCDIITVRRPGVELPVKGEDLPFAPEIRERLMDRVIQGRQCDVSSTEIRSRVAQGRSIRYLVPFAVEEYIRERGLYRGENACDEGRGVVTFKCE